MTAAPHTIDEFLGLPVGYRLGPSEWFAISQERISLFATATDDLQWIHVDPDRARAESPFGTTIAHGYLTLSLISWISEQLIQVTDASMVINYGLNRVRFPSPVPVDSLVRGHGEIVSSNEIDGGIEVAIAYTVERSGSSKPACVAESVVRFYR